MNQTGWIATALGCLAIASNCGSDSAAEVLDPPSMATAMASSTQPQARADSVAAEGVGDRTPRTNPTNPTPATAAPSGSGTSAAIHADSTLTGSGGEQPAGASGGAGSTGLAADASVPTMATVMVMDLPAELTNVDVTQNTKRRFGAPHVAVNPLDPNNIIVLASSNLGYTRDCLPAQPGSDCEMVAPGGNFLLQQPRGFARTKGFMDIGVFVSFDRGKTFEYVDVSDLVPPDDPMVRSRGEGPIAALPDGTFLIGFNAVNWGNWETQPMTFFPNGGVGVIKSTDGGATWRWTSYSFTPADWPFGGSDPITGTFYVTSGLAGLSTLGPRSNGDPDSSEGSIADRWISSTQDGETWTDPQPLGGMNGASHVGAGHSPAAAAHGLVATLFLASDASSCRFFVGQASTGSACVVFQTSTDAGATWSRSRVPTPAGFSPAALSVFVGADPLHKEHFTVALLNESGADFLVYRTPDAGKSWSEPVRVTEDASKTHFAPYVGFSPKGEFGLMWRTYEPDASRPTASPPIMPYSVWAAISKDGGATFSHPLKVSLANSPAPPDDPNDSFSFVGDHGPSGIALDGEDGVYVVWADWTPGERAIFFSAIHTQAFTF